MNEKMYREKSKEVIRRWIQKNGREGYEKIFGGYEGFFYRKTLQNSNCTINVNILLPFENTLIFEAALGIHVSNAAHLPAVKLYCQEIKTYFGAVNVDADNHNVQFHVESSLMDNPVSEETLSVFEKEAIRIFELHTENLSNLAIGKLLSTNIIKDHRKRSGKKRNTFDASINVIHDYLINKSGYNSVGKRLDENDETIFYCQAMTEEETFRISYRVVDEGILIIKGEYGENAFVVPGPYRYAVAGYLNDENAKHKYTSFSIGDATQGVSSSVCVSLLDGTIGIGSIEFFEQILLRTLSSSIETIEMLGAGLVPKENADSNEIKELAKRFASREMRKNMLETLQEIANPVRGLSHRGNLLSGELKEEKRPELMPSFPVKERIVDAEDKEISMSDFAKNYEKRSDDVAEE